MENQDQSTQDTVETVVMESTAPTQEAEPKSDPMDPSDLAAYRLAAAEVSVAEAKRNIVLIGLVNKYGISANDTLDFDKAAIIRGK